MPIDASRNIVFIHVPKTGGTSIEQMLGLNTERHFFSPTPMASLTPATKTPQHFTWLELCRNLPGDFLQAAYKIAFVRNPWDRLVSEYCWRRSWFLRRFRAPESYFYTADDLATLDSFVRLLTLPISARLDAGRGFDGHLEPQVSYVRDEHSRVVVDFLGRFERFNEDVGRLASVLGVSAANLPHAERSPRRVDYRSYYTGFSRSAVAEFYRDDIDAFGYEF